MKEWYNYNKADTEFGAFVEKVSGYLAKPEHRLRRRKFELIAEYGDHLEGWTRQYSNNYKMIFTNMIYDFCCYLAQNAEPIEY